MNPEEYLLKWWDSDHYLHLCEIGSELYKVHNYANSWVVDDLFSQTIIHLTQSAYFSGCAPIIRIEQSLWISKDLGNEYAYALALRAYLEVAGRAHKGLRLWRQYASKKKSLKEFHNGVRRLLAKYQPNEGSPGGNFPGKGFNVLTLIESLEDRMPDITVIYKDLSGYVHGDYENQVEVRKSSWLSEQKLAPNPVISSFTAIATKLREVSLEDFEELLRVTKPLRDRFDKLKDSDKPK